MPSNTAAQAVAPPLRSPIGTCILAWLVPGAGHYFVGRKWRALIVFLTVALCFAVGLLMRGPFFEPSAAGDVLTRVVQYGGFIGDLANGALYFAAAWSGYAPPQSAGHNPEYGSKFLVCAGLLNILAMVDAYEIAVREKD